MKRESALILVLAAALIGITPPPALAAEAQKFTNYLVLKGGIYSPSQSFDLNNFNGGSTTHLDSESGFNGEAAIGAYVFPFLAIELGGGYFESKGTPAVPPGETKLKVFPVVATGKALLPLGWIEPYGELGIGAYIADLEVSGNLGSFTGATKVAFGVHAGGGVNVNFSQSFFMGVEGRYLWAEPSFGGQDIKLDGFTTTVNLGYRF